MECKCKECSRTIKDASPLENTCRECYDFHKQYWDKRVKALEENSSTIAIINQNVYYIGNEDTIGDRGFDGMKYIIRFNDGREVHTTNLWSNGHVPDDYKDKLPDNASFYFPWRDKETQQKEEYSTLTKQLKLSKPKD